MRRARLRADFARRFDAYSTLLCMAAQFGITPARERDYRRQRESLQESYRRVRVYLSEGTEQGRRRRVSPKQDDFDDLLSSTRLRTVLESDEGNLIARLLQVQENLTRWNVAEATGTNRRRLRWHC